MTLHLVAAVPSGLEMYLSNVTKCIAGLSWNLLEVFEGNWLKSLKCVSSDVK